MVIHVPTVQVASAGAASNGLVFGKNPCSRTEIEALGTWGALRRRGAREAGGAGAAEQDVSPLESATLRAALGLGDRVAS